MEPVEGTEVASCPLLRVWGLGFRFGVIVLNLRSEEGSVTLNHVLNVCQQRSQTYAPPASVLCLKS